MRSWVSLSGERAETTILDAEEAAWHVICCEEVSDLTIEGLTVTGGHARGDILQTYGGGICCIGSSPNIANNTIRANLAGDGGGISCRWSSPRITNNTITGNWAACAGGGIHCFMSAPTIQNNTITDNRAALIGGGGLCCICERSGTTIISNNAICDNLTESAGGGVLCDESSPTITNNTVINNKAEKGCGGIQSEQSLPTITDCILWGNGDDLDGCKSTHCCIEDDDHGEGNIHASPMFVSGPFGDYYLDPNSPCRNAGSRSAKEAGLSDRTTQTDGAPDSGTVDVGFHYPILSQGSAR